MADLQKTAILNWDALYSCTALICRPLLNAVSSMRTDILNSSTSKHGIAPLECREDSHSREDERLVQITIIITPESEESEDRTDFIEC